jgi:hypothetical protein
MELKIDFYKYSNNINSVEKYKFLV